MGEKTSLSLTEQCIDMVLRDWKEKGVAPYQIHLSVGRVWPEFKATIKEVNYCNNEFSNGEIEIDDDAITSPNTVGKWVSAWVFMSAEAIEIANATQEDDDV